MLNVVMEVTNTMDKPIVPMSVTLSAQKLVWNGTEFRLLAWKEAGYGKNISNMVKTPKSNGSRNSLLFGKRPIEFRKKLPMLVVTFNFFFFATVIVGSDV